MNETTHDMVPAPFDTLHAELRSLIASSRQRLAGAVNAELTRLYWSVGGRLRTAQTLAQPEMVATLSRQLGWSHFVNLLPLKTEQARQFYAKRVKKPHRPDLVRRIQPRTSGTAANAQRRHHCGRILDRAAAQGRAGAAPAPSFDRSAGAAGAAWGVVVRGRR